MALISGLYAASTGLVAPLKEELRFDVDGNFPQMALSGTLTQGLNNRADWMARPLTPHAGGFRGPIVVKTGSAALVPYAQVAASVAGSTLKVTYSGPGMADLVRTYRFRRRAFRKVAFEFDAEENVARVQSIATHQHPHRPAALASETLTINKVYSRAGFVVRQTGGGGTVPAAGSGSDASWSDSEMHDAMQVHFAAFANQPAWTLWTFFAGLHEDGTSLGGIMFDQSGEQRQGTALFMNSFISQAPAGDPAPAAWCRRMAFWTAVHEMGHAFNLLHAWQKHLGAPWLPLASGYDQLSFMNYPFFYLNGPPTNNANTVRFFNRFMFRFTDEELLFMRHAPERSVIMGGEAFGDDHGLEQAEVAESPSFALQIRANRGAPVFEFLEPVVLELKLTNLRRKPARLAADLLRASEGVTVVVQRRGGPRRVWHPYAHYCRQSSTASLAPGGSHYESLFVSAGTGRWLIDEPGYYRVQACVRVKGEDIVSNALEVRVAPPRSWDEEYVAQDYFSDAVGRVLNFDGSRHLDAANDVLEEVARRFAGRNAATHARVALALPRLRRFKLLGAPKGAGGRRRYAMQRLAPDAKAAGALSAVLAAGGKRSEAAAAALGHIDYREYALRCAQAYARQGDAARARALRGTLVETLRRRKVLPRVLDEIRRTPG